MGIIKNAIPFGSGFNIGAAAPIDARMRVEKKTDLTTCWTNELPAFAGMSVVVIEEAKTYVLKQSGVDKNNKPTCDATVLDNWIEVGSGAGSVSIPIFTIKDGKIDEATEKNIGQVFYITTGTDDYPAGPYIVTGAGEVAKLGTTTATGDIAGDVSTLKGKVSTLETNVGSLQDTVSTLNTKFGDYYTKTEAEKFVDETELAAYTSAHATVHENLNKTISDLSATVAGIPGTIDGVKTELESKIDAKANQSDLEALQGTVATKANQSDLEALQGTVSTLDTTLTGKIDDNTALIGGLSDKVAKVTVVDNGGNSYTITDANGKSVTIDVPTDLVVKSGSVKTVETDGTPYAEAKAGDLYIELILNVDGQDPIYIPANKLVDDYTSGDDAILVNGRVITFNKDILTKYAEKDVVASDIATAITNLDLDNKLAATKESAVTEAGTAADTKIAKALEDYTTTKDLTTTLGGYVTSSELSEYKDTVDAAISDINGDIDSLNALVNGDGESKLSTAYADIAALKVAVGTQPEGESDVFTSLSTLSAAVKANSDNIVSLGDAAVKTVVVLGKEHKGNTVTLDVASAITDENKGTHLVNGTAVIDYVSSVRDSIYVDLNGKTTISIVDSMPDTVVSDVIYIDKANNNAPKIKLGDDVITLGESLYAAKDVYATAHESLDGETVVYSYTSGLMSAESMKKLHEIDSISTGVIQDLIEGRI